MFYGTDDTTSTASATTLVNPPLRLANTHKELIITKPSALNNILLINGSRRYIIATTDVAAAKTSITDTRTGEVVARIHRRKLFLDEVRFEGQSAGTGAMKLKIGKEWLKETKMGDGRVRWDVEIGSSGSFAWRLDVVHRLVLCPASDMDTPIAWVQLPDETKKFALVVPSSAESMWDYIVAGWVILEQRLRLEEKDTEKASGRSSFGAQFATSGI